MPFPLIGWAAVAGATAIVGTVVKTLVVSEAKKSFVDNVIRDKVINPKCGSVVHCDLLPGVAEHSGIYVGYNQIVHLNKHGNIELVDFEEFLSGTPAISIYMSCDGSDAVGSAKVAERARNAIGSHRDYNVILDNCHQFCSGCLTGNFENSDNFLWMLKDTANSILGANDWRVLDRD